MDFKNDLTSEVRQIFKEQWTVQTISSVPEPDDLRLNNHAKDLEKATVLYADLDGSTNMVDRFNWGFSAEVYKAYLRCAARLIKLEGGVITAYDGDRIMAIFTGDRKNTNAVRAAMKINYAVENIINSEMSDVYDKGDFKVKHVIGIDTSQLRAARIGVRGYNDLVWIGRSANYAAKLTTQTGRSIWITKAVYTSMNKSVRTNSVTRQNFWISRNWSGMDNMEIFGSSCTLDVNA